MIVEYQVGRTPADTMAGNSGDVRRTVTNKVIAILLAFAGGQDHSLGEIARLTRLPLSTAHRLINELVRCDVLARAGNGHYRTGDRLTALRLDPVAPVPDKHERVRDVMEDLSAAYSPATIRFGLLEDDHVIYIEKDSPIRPVSSCFQDAVLPAHATAMGKAMLAFADPGTVHHIISAGLTAYTPFTVVSAAQLRRILAITRLTGIALSQRELDLDDYAMAAPVFTSDGRALAALELSGLRPRDLRVARPGLVLAARILSRSLMDDPHIGPLDPRRETRLDAALESAVKRGLEPTQAGR